MRRANLIGGWAIAALLAAPGMAPAAWDNVFQLTCCGRPHVAARIAYAAPAPCCQQQVAYVQRSFYQPVMSYRAVAHYEPVMSYHSSYYWEPVQTMSYSLYVDPCTGCSQQVATPQVSYSLRQQCNAVTNYVQRVSYEPVTQYRQAFYMEAVAVNPCCQTPVVAAAPPVVAAPPVSLAPPVTSDNVAPMQTPPPPLNVPQPQPQPPPQTTEKLVPSQTVYPQVRPVPSTTRADRIASLGSTINGTVVRSNNQPQPGARLRFVSTSGQEAQPVTADATGRFAVNLASGSWKMYMDDAAGRSVYHSDFQARNAENRNVMVVSR